jgi:citrate lyase subunit beta/citryl-CoA lyase
LRSPEVENQLVTRIARIAAARSLLFVPGDRPERFDKACRSGADAVILDLEDAVCPERKALARACVREWLTTYSEVRGPLILLRTNGINFDEVDAELSVASLSAVDALVLPKANSPREIGWIHRVLPCTPVLPLIETALGVCAVQEVVQAPGVARLLFGSVDLMLDLGMDDESALDPYRAQIVLSSRAANLPAPVDGVTRNFVDMQSFAAVAARARRRGLGGMLCIHPRQVEVVNQQFLPSDEELAQAHRIVEAVAAGGHGAVSLDGAMVDAPVLIRAQRVLANAAQRHGAS